MASPFTFFRKNQQSMMVALVILAMMAFTLDSVFASRDSQFTMLGVMLGAAICGIAGIGQGKWIQYGIGGAILGGLCGWIMPRYLRSPADGEPIIATSLGVFDNKRIYDLQIQRGIADQFMARAFESSFGEGTAQFATRFGFGHQNQREDLIFGEIMRSEADKLGIVVTDDMVSSYINSQTSNKLTGEAFAKIRTSLSIEGQKISEDRLFDILRSEIKGMMAYRATQPQVSVMPPPPELYYNLYKRLNVSQRLNTAMIDVDAFLDAVPEPEEAQIVDLFSNARLYYPNEKGPGEAGFRQPRKVKLAYLEVDYKTIESQTPAVTDADAEAYYNENKETLYKRPVTPKPPEVPATPAGEDANPDSEKASTEAVEKTSTGEKPAEVPATPV
ncbi:MAG: hypothetical protein KDA91_24480, partial [Planctomycetaceae bacterium]|nr:hypothetical protein [Planctomycetaceae bacterium]